MAVAMGENSTSITILLMILYLTFLLLPLVIGVLSILFARRIVEWAERTFRPALKRMDNELGLLPPGEKLPETPKPMTYSAIWLLRIFGIISILETIFILFSLFYNYFSTPR
ncbi:MAG: hypothetical protein PHO26_05110 [Dehalococcoidia bacterium]|nr:hypothetical protein [Dehalococcoidia bacterium]MDD5494421.1 hypothetical protein [Dehalococcoidia bacterium]